MRRMVGSVLLSTAVLAAAPVSVWAQGSADSSGKLAATPQMGWNSWNRFACNIDDKLIRETADAMVKTGLKDAGYQYINIDDCWHGARDENGNIQADKQ